MLVEITLYILNWDSHGYHTLYYASAQMAAFDAYAAYDKNSS